jgi:DNA-directed RNA polymerase specialized sigma24 family protein
VEPETEFAHLWAQHPAVTREMRRLLPRAPQADLFDLVHDVFERAWGSLLKHDEPVEYARGYLFTIAHRIAMDYCRRPSRLADGDPQPVLERRAALEDDGTRETLLDLARLLETHPEVAQLLMNEPLHQLSIRKFSRILGLDRQGKGKRLFDRLKRRWLA